MKWLNLIRVLQKGVTLSNAETWRKTATATAALSAFLTALVSFGVSQGWFEQIDPQTIMEISGALVTLAFTVLSYLGVATDENQGKLQKPKQPNRFIGE